MAAAAVSSPVCSLYSDSNVVTIDRYVTYYCESDKKPIKITVTAISANWEWAYSFGSLVNPSGWTSTTNASTEASGGISSVYVYLRPLAAVPPGSTATATVSIDRPNGTTTSVISLAAVRALQTSNFQTTCSPESITVATSASGSVTCTISGNDIASGATVGVSNLMIAAPAGWTVSPSVMSGSVTANAPFSVVLTLRPACGAPVNPTLPNVTVNATLTFQSGAPFAAPAGAFKAAHGATSTVTALITSSNLDWSKPYSFASQSVSGSMTYQVQASGCAGWNVQISSTPFAYTGSAGGAAIPGSNIQVVPGSVTAMSGSTSNVTPGSAGSLGGPIKMLSASETWGVGTYLQTLGLSVTIPGGARVGTYTATISLTAASGP
jgi:hypothetical protein